jgi:branched-subunit amino acid transport protein
MRLLLTFLGMGLVTYMSRALPLLLLADRSLPRWATALLAGIPVAVLASFTTPLVLSPEGSLDISLGNLTLLASIPTILVALKTRSLIATTVFGIAAMMVLRAVL